MDMSVEEDNQSTAFGEGINRKRISDVAKADNKTSDSFVSLRKMELDYDRRIAELQYENERDIRHHERQQQLGVSITRCIIVIILCPIVVCLFSLYLHHLMDARNLDIDSDKEANRHQFQMAELHANMTKQIPVYYNVPKQKYLFNFIPWGTEYEEKVRWVAHSEQITNKKTNNAYDDTPSVGIGNSASPAAESGAQSPTSGNEEHANTQEESNYDQLD